MLWNLREDLRDPACRPFEKTGHLGVQDGFPRGSIKAPEGFLRGVRKEANHEP